MLVGSGDDDSRGDGHCVVIEGGGDDMCGDVIILTEVRVGGDWW